MMNFVVFFLLVSIPFVYSSRELNALADPPTYGTPSVEHCYHPDNNQAYWPGTGFVTENGVDCKCMDHGGVWDCHDLSHPPYPPFPSHPPVYTEPPTPFPTPPVYTGPPTPHHVKPGIPVLEHYCIRPEDGQQFWMGTFYVNEEGKKCLCVDQDVWECEQEPSVSVDNGNMFCVEEKMGNAVWHGTFYIDEHFKRCMCDNGNFTCDSLEDNMYCLREVDNQIFWHNTFYYMDGQLCTCLDGTWDCHPAIIHACCVRNCQDKTDCITKEYWPGTGYTDSDTGVSYICENGAWIPV